jgi:hypothetical protein
MWLLRKLPILCALSGAASAAVPVGSVVMYSDGRVEKLMSHRDGELLWEDDRKRQFVRSENPIMPLLRRTDFLSGKGYLQSVGEGDLDSIRQLPSGTRVGFTVERVRHSGERSTRNWDCKQLGKRQEKVLGVMRELESFACERFVIQRKTWQKQFRESRKLSYSRDLGLVVEMQRKTRKRSSDWKLVSIVPPDKTSYKHLSKKVRKLRAAK